MSLTFLRLMPCTFKREEEQKRRNEMKRERMKHVITEIYGW